ncbi:ATP-binding cassette domain-containing protein [Paenibacillus urinalis]|uniref:ATP-binding cassette domain-containing protein n=1 Tax=Paenibacillus urinalis TaxID=521520 RepID=A0AAX3MZD5_9BACL|nr:MULTISPECIES: ATP-binding cassette domain-containing protein [Paenibacillus]WDH82971.1 ATP-binding cassette domain-containing protein [Paenibacillus urinalis]WDH99024.1 ATP-binding cassette domain-containing protein [Paenibacillus urinalis]WDI02717.1 ATP-binding cassette domain-containing protein [Paenibacillus urinalis]GAK40197.1 dipeptide ABC transporter ATP-binding protein [Paenibacillus sp. TCA20]
MQLEAKKLGFRYGRRQDWCMRDIHLSISSGEMVGLRGPSGAGKSTLARLLAGYLQPLEGEVLLDGAPLSLYTGYAPVQLVLQHPESAVNPRWHMHKVLQEAGVYDRELLHSLGIEEDWLARRPGELSGGELQRFCVARALGVGTKFLIADEMTTMLDAVTQAQIWNVVKKMAVERELGILVISHEGNLLSQLCSRIIEWK